MKAVITDTDKKRESILDKAIRRFSHFGIQKTTMSELAEDLAMSKPALYYYFPDKSSIVLAVAERITKEFLDRVIKDFHEHNTVEGGIKKLILIRKEFLQRYFIIQMTEGADMYFHDPGFIKVMYEARRQEQQLIASQLEKGIQRGEFKVFNTLRISGFLLDILMGLRVCALGGKSPFINNEQLEILAEKQLEVIQIFLNGLK